MRSRIGVWWVALATAGLLACGRTETPGDSPVAVPPAGAAQAAAVEKRIGSERVLEPGAVQVRGASGRIDLEARDADRERVLRALARHASFDLELGAMPARKLTLALAGAPLALVLASVLDDVPYSCDYEASAEDGQRLVWLSAGWFEEGVDAVGGAEPGTASGKALAPGPRHPGRAPPPNQQGLRRQYLRWLAERLRDTGAREARRAADEQRRVAEHEAARVLGEHANEEERRRAVLAIDPDGPGVAALSEAAVVDGSQQVRLEAVRALGEADSYEATRALIAALEDPAPDVVAEALTQLGYAYDPTVLQHFPEGLASHPDGRVRDAFEEMQRELAE